MSSLCGVIRRSEIFVDYEVLLRTDEFFRAAIRKVEFQNEEEQAHHPINQGENR
jgi:hypothetical protein